jgi:hypothetical protein
MKALDYEAQHLRRMTTADYDDNEETLDTLLTDYGAAARAIDAALQALVRKCERTAEIRRSVGGETLCCMILWQSMKLLGVEHIKPQLLTALAEKIGYAEARRLIDQDEASSREAAEMAALAGEPDAAL